MSRMRGKLCCEQVRKYVGVSFNVVYISRTVQCNATFSPLPSRSPLFPGVWSGPGPARRPCACGVTYRSECGAGITSPVFLASGAWRKRELLQSARL